MNSQKFPSWRLVGLFIVWVIQIGCVTYVPVDEWTLARAAFEAAKESEAAKYVPALWFKAEQAYRDGQQAYKDRNYDRARKLFVQAKLFAEQAENAAVLEQRKSGDVIP